MYLQNAPGIARRYPKGHKNQRRGISPLPGGMPEALKDNLEDRGDCQDTRKLYKTSHFVVGLMVGNSFVGGRCLNRQPMIRKR